MEKERDRSLQVRAEAKLQNRKQKARFGSWEASRPAGLQGIMQDTQQVLGSMDTCPCSKYFQGIMKCLMTFYEGLTKTYIKHLYNIPK